MDAVALLASCTLSAGRSHAAGVGQLTLQPERTTCDIDVAGEQQHL